MELICFGHVRGCYLGGQKTAEDTMCGDVDPSLSDWNRRIARWAVALRFRLYDESWRKWCRGRGEALADRHTATLKDRCESDSLASGSWRERLPFFDVQTVQSREFPKNRSEGWWAESPVLARPGSAKFGQFGTGQRQPPKKVQVNTNPC